MDDAKISTVPELSANHVDAALIHEGCYRQDCRRTVNQADDSGIDRGRSRGADHKRILKIGEYMDERDLRESFHESDLTKRKTAAGKAEIVGHEFHRKAGIYLDVL